MGGADIYRGQAAPATAGLHGHDEFFADFAKQVLPVPASILGSVRRTHSNCVQYLLTI